MNHPPYHFIEIQKKTVYVEMFQITYKYSNSFIRNISKISKAHLSHLRLFRNTSHERLKTLCGTLKNMVEYEERLNVDIHFNCDPAQFKNVKCLLFNGNVSRMIKVDDNQ